MEVEAELAKAASPVVMKYPVRLEQCKKFTEGIKQLKAIHRAWIDHFNDCQAGYDMEASAQEAHKPVWTEKSEELAKAEIQLGQRSFEWPLEIGSVKATDSSDRAPGYPPSCKNKLVESMFQEQTQWSGKG